MFLPLLVSSVLQTKMLLRGQSMRGLGSSSSIPGAVRGTLWGRSPLHPQPSRLPLALITKGFTSYCLGVGREFLHPVPPPSGHWRKPTSGGASVPTGVHTLLRLRCRFSAPPEQVYLCAENIFSLSCAHDGTMWCPWQKGLDLCSSYEL